MPTATSSVGLAASPTSAGLEISSPTGLPTTLPGGGEWDFGDAPDPGFPSLAASDGARHANIAFEWLGQSVNGEPDSQQIDGDQYDDGVVPGELDACTEQALEMEITVRSREDPEHPYGAQHLLYLNVLVDWNGDGSWSGRVQCPQGVVAPEWAVRNLPVDVSSWPQGSLSTRQSILFSTGPLTGQVWARFSLSYAEVVSGADWDGRGAFAHGETEDYLLTVAAPPARSPEAATWTAVIPTQPAATPGAVAPGPPLLCCGAVLVLLALLILLLLVAFRRRSWRLALLALLVLLGLPVVALLLHGADLANLTASGSAGSPSASPAQPEPLVPTPTPTSEATGEVDQPLVDATTASATSSPATPGMQPTPSVVTRLATSPLPSLIPVRDRFGFGVAISTVEQYDAGQLHAGWYLDWSHDAEPSRPHGMEYVQMVRVRGGSPVPGSEELERTARMNPGSLWLIGNEPDVLWQDDSTPEEYAEAYHQAYATLKGADPTCQVAIGGVSQPTPLRLQYLDMILEAYRDLYGQMIPVDVWNVHGFILREERDSWGVGIPAGIAAESGRLFELEDHDSIEIFREQILAFRRWMKDNGQRNKPLIVSEYGILMPAEYGFSPEGVRDFLYATFDFFLTTTDAELGYPPDGNRLVQRWCWYSLSDTVYPTGNLFDPSTGQITPLGRAYGSYVLSH